ncbi:uncharacterized protein LOC111613619 [Centruroides sculpturatus]|uniref:uncharacterized protein LOC111613619 n=1 Tax=Centruroides sculpturatus TaxID=218467 RepID=UPI000C6D855B|nr:uncharacterized protein LOC111613619 [Centruroides sculpturatus]
MWGKDPSELDPSVLARVPVTIGYQDRYFFDKYEGLPIEGYTKSVEKMLAHKNIKVILKTDASNLISFRDGKIYYRAKQVKVPLVYTGPIDHLFNYRYGLLEYRSLDIKVQTLARDQFQPVGVVNYPADPTMTRISEYKHMTGQKVVGKTVITREYPGAYQPGSPRFGTRYYPMMTDQAKVAYQKYQELARQYPNLHLVGRLATFKYINMDQAVKIALEKAAQLLGKAPG